MIYCRGLNRFFSCLFSEDVLKLLCQGCQTFIRSEHHIYHFILASLIKGLKKAFAQTVLSLEAENRFPSSWNLKIQRVPFGHLRIRTDDNSKRYQYITIQISVKEVIKLIRLLCHLFWNGLALSIKKKKKSCFSFLIMMWKDTSSFSCLYIVSWMDLRSQHFKVIIIPLLGKHMEIGNYKVGREKEVKK